MVDFINFTIQIFPMLDSEQVGRRRVRNQFPTDPEIIYAHLVSSFNNELKSATCVYLGSGAKTKSETRTIVPRA